MTFTITDFKAKSAAGSSSIRIYDNKGQSKRF